MGLADTAELAVELNLSGNFDKRMKGANKRLGGLSKATRNIGRGLGNVARNLGKVGLVAAAAAGAGIAGAVKVAADFEDAMTESLAIQKGVTAEMRADMAQAAREVGRSTTFGAKDAAEAYFFLASAGLSAEAQLKAMPRVAAFAQAGNFDLATATDLATDAQAALGLTSKDAAKNLSGLNRVQDVLVKANTLANASVEQFSTSLTRKAGPSMRALGIDMEEGVAVLAAFADAGVKGELAGTTFAATVDGLTKAAVTNRKEFKKYGIQIFDNNGELKNMGQVTAILERRFAGMSDQQRAAAFQQLGLNRNTKTGIELLLGSSGKIKRYEKDLRKAGGTTDEVANKQLKGFNKQLGLLRDNLVDVGITIGTALLPGLTRITTRLRKLIQENQPAIEEFGANIGKAFDDFTSPENLDKTFEDIRNFVAGIPWEDIQKGLQFGADIAGKAIDIFNSLPREVKTGLIALLAAGKLTGGVIGLGSAAGLLKSIFKVATMTVSAGVVNVGGVPGGGGKGVLPPVGGGGGAAALPKGVRQMGVSRGIGLAGALLAIGPTIIRQVEAGQVFLDKAERDRATFSPELLAVLDRIESKGAEGVSAGKSTRDAVNRGTAATKAQDLSVTIKPPNINISAYEITSSTQRAISTNRTRRSIG